MNFESYIPSNVSKYLEGFNRRRYSQICDIYKEECRDFFAAIEQCGDIDAAAKELVDWMDGRVTGIFKKRQYCDLQYFLLAFAAPAALAQNTEKSAAFAEATRKAWVERHPDMPYECTTMEHLSNGFSNTIFGLPLSFGGKK